MSHPQLNITAEAESDLREIWLYSVGEWGQTQADRYLDELMEMCNQLAVSKKLGKAVFEIGRNVYVYRCNHHYIFYLKKEDDLIFIAFMHEKRDILRHVAGRLS